MNNKDQEPAAIYGTDAPRIIQFGDPGVVRFQRMDVENPQEKDYIVMTVKNAKGEKMTAHLSLENMAGIFLAMCHGEDRVKKMNLLMDMIHEK